MQFSKILGVSAAVSVASAAYANVTSTADVYSNTTTVVTITSCEDHVCTEVPVTTGVTVVTKTIEGTVTEYTTYCPLSSESKAASTPAPKETTSTATKQITSTAASNATTASVSSYEGAAAKAVPAVAAIAAGVALLF